jgi:pyruvate dehydrogenase E1 component alpha subunit
MADPEEYREDEEVEEWRERDPIKTFSERLEDLDFDSLDRQAVEMVDAAVEFAEQSPFPELDSIYANLYA